VEEAAKGERTWLCEVDDAKLLKDMFADPSETRVAYDTTTG